MQARTAHSATTNCCTAAHGTAGLLVCTCPTPSTASPPAAALHCCVAYGCLLTCPPGAMLLCCCSSTNRCPPRSFETLSRGFEDVGTQRSLPTAALGGPRPAISGAWLAQGSAGRQAGRAGLLPTDCCSSLWPSATCLKPFPTPCHNTPNSCASWLLFCALPFVFRCSSTAPRIQLI